MAVLASGLVLAGLPEPVAALSQIAQGIHSSAQENELGNHVGPLVAPSTFDTGEVENFRGLVRTANPDRACCLRLELSAGQRCK